MRECVTQKSLYGYDIELTKDDLLKRVRLFNKDPMIQKSGLKIVVTGGSESYAYHTRLVGECTRIEFEVYASGDWGLRELHDLTEEENSLYYQLWDIWCAKGLNRI